MDRPPSETRPVIRLSFTLPPSPPPVRIVRIESRQAARRRAVETAFAALAERTRGAVLLAGDATAERIALEARGLTRASVEPVASAGRWPVVTALLPALDEAGIALDAPLGPEHYGDVPLARATPAQLIASIAGMPSTDSVLALVRRRLPSFELALHLMTQAPVAGPGEHFLYGAGGLQVAGDLVERGLGRPVQGVVEDALRRLGMTGTRLWPRTGTGYVAGGLATTADDLARFARHVLANPDPTVEAVRTTRVRSVTLPEGGRLVRGHGLGIWVEREARGPAGRALLSIGAFGSAVWIDRELGLWGVLVARGRLSSVLDPLDGLRDALRSMLDAGRR